MGEGKIGFLSKVVFGNGDWVFNQGFFWDWGFN